MEQKTFNKRAFVSVALLVSALGLPVSGIMNHNLQFEKLTVDRHFWMTLHNISALLFCIFALIHVSFNWRSIIHYMQIAKKTFISKEAVTAIAFVLTIILFFTMHVFHVRS